MRIQTGATSRLSGATVSSYRSTENVQSKRSRCSLTWRRRSLDRADTYEKASRPGC
jgi:hypothetical protein